MGVSLFSMAFKVEKFVMWTLDVICTILSAHFLVDNIHV